VLDGFGMESLVEHCVLAQVLDMMLWDEMKNSAMLMEGEMI
jgi:hypothetical protein